DDRREAERLRTEAARLILQFGRDFELCHAGRETRSYDIERAASLLTGNARGVDLGFVFDNAKLLDEVFGDDDLQLRQGFGERLLERDDSRRALDAKLLDFGMLDDLGDAREHLHAGCADLERQAGAFLFELRRVAWVCD